MSYFPCDIPFMSDDELKENGIHIPKNVSDTNVGKIEYIGKKEAIDAVEFGITTAWAIDIASGEKKELFASENEELQKAVDRIRNLTSADVAPVERSRWIRDGDGAMCEKCGREAVYQVVDMHWEYENFCPHCGARMEKGKT